ASCLGCAGRTSIWRHKRCVWPVRFNARNDQMGQVHWSSFQPRPRRACACLPLPPVLCAILREHKAREEEERTINGWQEHDLIFASERGTPIEATNLVARSFKPALKRADLPAMPFHGLRHSAATLLIALGLT